MAVYVPVYERMETHAALAAGNAVEAAGVRCETEGSSLDVVAGTYDGLSVRLATAPVGTPAIIFRVYDGVVTTIGADGIDRVGIMLHEFSVTFDAQFDPSIARPQSPVPFFTGLVVTAEADEAAQTVDVTPIVIPMAGRR